MDQEQERGKDHRVNKRKLYPIAGVPSGLERETDIKDTDPSKPKAVICVSPYLTPSKYKTDKEYELMRLCRPRI